ncbi:MAG: 5-(carboxyamino)imidazole ribonucleotide synthase [Armatimonadetes bacterium]|nr:5-(carboxyamino)imidazole ribonucleotide synthase [Armatimonadota bacterium]
MKIGVLGAGQLGRMLALAGIPMGHEFVFFDDTPEPCAAGLGQVDSLASPGLHALDALTYEFENIESYVDRFQEFGIPIRPSPNALKAACDRLWEKDLLVELGIPTPKYREFVEAREFAKSNQEIGYPLIAKTRRFGYDGKGQVRLDGYEDHERLWEMAGEEPMILESVVPFDRELSIIAARCADGKVAIYPLVENHHRNGILRLTIAPAPNLTPELQGAAEAYARKVLEQFDYVGVIAIELFQVGTELLVNEIAPRVHNSGHWTLDGAETSQFENHIRAITDMPLGSTLARGYSAMINIFGERPDPAAVLAVPGAHYHVYGKSARPGRKIGHITVGAADRETLAERVAALRYDDLPVLP